MLHRHHNTPVEATTHDIEIMPLHEHDELKCLTVPDGAEEATSTSDLTAVANGEAAVPGSPSYKEMFARAPADLRGSFEDLKGLIHQHTGTHKMISSVLFIYVMINTG